MTGKADQLLKSYQDIKVNHSALLQQISKVTSQRWISFHEYQWHLGCVSCITRFYFQQHYHLINYISLKTINCIWLTCMRLGIGCQSQSIICMEGFISFSYRYLVFLKKKKFPLEFPTISNHCCLNSLKSSSYSRKCTCHQLTSELHFLLKGFLPEGISKCQDRTWRLKE